MSALRHFVATLVAALLGVGGAPAEAHKTNLTIGQIVIHDADVRYRLGVSAHDLAAVLDIPPDFTSAIPAATFAARRALFAEYLDEKLVVRGDDRLCPRAMLDMEYNKLPEEVILQLVFRCPAPPRQVHISYRLFFGIDPGHRALGTIDAGRGPEEYLLDRAFADIEVSVDTPGPSLAAFGRVVLLGIEHILAGLDHVLFVVALLLGGGSFWALVRIVTAFTVAHSLTLSLAWFGALDLPARPVEILIAASVAYVAIENALGRGFSHRWLVAFGFGLVHGLGFFGVLRELDLDRTHALTALLGFNLGVEIGQLVIVAVVYPFLVWAAAHTWYRRAAVSGSLAILALALVWIVDRALT